jgi:hypothetical protein
MMNESKSLGKSATVAVVGSHSSLSPCVSTSTTSIKKEMQTCMPSSLSSSTTLVQHAVQVEICIDSVQGAIIASSAGAHRYFAFTIHTIQYHTIHHMAPYVNNDHCSLCLAIIELNYVVLSVKVD